MADINYVKSIGELIDEKVASSSISFTAGSTVDSATWTGLSINRAGFPTGAVPRSADFMFVYDATLGSGKTLQITQDVQDSADNSSWSDFATQAIVTVATGPSGGGRVGGVYRMANPSGNAPSGTKGVDLNGARQYVRYNVIPHLSATVTDTIVMISVAAFGGFDFLAAPTS